MNIKEKSTKLVVVGAGPGGYAAAFRAADKGMEVFLVDESPCPGGVCLYRGCIPSKALLHVAQVINESKEVATMGVEFAPPLIHLEKIRSWKDSVVEKLTKGLGQLCSQRKITYLTGRAQFLDAHTLKISQGSTEEIHLSFEQAILATGSHPISVKEWPCDSPHLLYSSSALELKDIPKKMLVIGGGYIGLELGSVYAALGSKITVIEMMDRILPGVDRDLVLPLKRRLDSVFEKFLLKTEVLKIQKSKRGLDVIFKNDQGESSDEFDKVLVSIGRRPRSSELNLEVTQVRLSGQGFVIVNPQRQTSEPHIYAIGDLTGEPMLAHKALHEARVAVESIAGENVSFEPQAIPAVVFTDPEIAWCGLTENQAQQKKQDVKVLRFPWQASGRAMTLGRTDGLTKLVVDSESEAILGMGVVGHGAGELIAEGVLAIEMGATATDLSMSIHPHPTLSETVMESAELFFGSSTHLFKPKKKP